MAQRPRLGQIKRNDVNYRTFEDQFEELEGNTSHFRNPVRTKGELPFDGNVDGTQCLVIGEGVVYYWDEQIQNWQPILGQVFNMDTATFKRWKKTYVAATGQTDFLTDVLFDVGKFEIDVYIQGILQDVDVDYIEFDERTIRFNEPVPAGAVVTLATPMIVESTISIETYLKRLENLEFNNYQMMMAQYYEGKGFEAQGIVYDGFINTDYIDYIHTTSNVMYDVVRKSMYMFHKANSGIVEQFDSNANIDTTKSSIYLRGSEITLPIMSTYSPVFVDDFSTKDLMDLTESNVFWNREKQLVTNDETSGGGNHYYKGDFMTTTGNADLVGFNTTVNAILYRYYYYSNNQYTYQNTGANANCFAVLPMGNLNALINAVAIPYKSAWPYSGNGYLYRGSNSLNHKTNGNEPSRGSYYDNYGQSVFADATSYWRPTTVYVRQWNKIVALQQYGETSGRYYQQLLSATGRAANFGNWSWHGRPSGLPTSMFGSPTSTYTQSSAYISQIGSTYDRLLIRSGNALYFLDSGYFVTKTLDWSKATRKPATYNVTSQQITADKRYLYFPARLLRDGYWGYYLEVFLIEDGSFVGEILVTRDNSGNPGTTAMGFDHDYNRIVLGQQGGYKYGLYGKNKNNIDEQASYASMLIFEAPDEMMREVISKPFTTNLPYVYYRLNASHVLNLGTIDYYIRFGSEAWTKINLGTNYTWTNPNGAKETTVQLRAVLQSSLTASTAPELTDWTLNVRPYNPSARYRSKQSLINMEGVTGGRLEQSQIVPNETHIQWFIELDEESNRYYAGSDGHFSFPEMSGDAIFTMEANMATSNVLMSPVVHDVKMQMYRDDEGALYTETSRQLHDIRETSIWVTTSAGNEKYEVDVSRDNGETWFKAIKKQAVQVTNGDIETNWYHLFSGTGNGERDFKIRFRINGATEILQYGATIN